MIPSIYEMLLPIMKLLEDDKPHKIRDVIRDLAKQFEVTDQERRKLTPVAKRGVFYVRVLWAVSTLRNTELLQNIEMGVFKITARGHEILKKNPDKIDRQYLSQFPKYQDFVNKKSLVLEQPISDVDETVSPIETIEEKYLELEKDLNNELLAKVKNMSPFVFEDLVTKLLTAMGYGFPEEGQHARKTRDGGIDGVINQDELGLEKIYLQAKRWSDSNVGIDDIHKFVGALHDKHAKKGVFITTSAFTQDAKDSAKNSDVNIILIDGEVLTKLLYNNNLGVITSKTYEIKKIDQDFFDENSI